MGVKKIDFGLFLNHKRIMNHRFENSRQAFEILGHSFGENCLTIVFSLEHLDAGQKKDWNHLEKIVEQARQRILDAEIKHSSRLLNRLFGISKFVDFSRNDRAIGIFVSEGIAGYIRFPFKVKESVVLSDHFYLKEIYRLAQFHFPYWVVSLSEKQARLFRGLENQLMEIKDDRFPMYFIDNFEYSVPSRASSFMGSAQVKAFEHDTSIMQKIREEEWMHILDRRLKGYVEKKEDVILCGTKTNTDRLFAVSSLKNQIVSRLTGGYDWYDAQEFKALVWPESRKLSKHKTELEIDRLKQKSGEGLAESGVHSIWHLLHEGRAETVFLDEEFEQAGYISLERPDVLLDNKPSAESVYFPYLTDALLKKTVDQGGKVVFVGAGLLPEGADVAAICRY